MYKSYKKFENMSVCHRNYHAANNTVRDSTKCSLIHGYTRSVELEFSSDELDAQGWVYDFGNCKMFKQWFDANYDHATLISSTDPLLAEIKEFASLGLLRVTVIEDVCGHNPGIEGSCKHLFDVFNKMLQDSGAKARISKVTVWEHDHNYASYSYDYTQIA